MNRPAAFAPAFALTAALLVAACDREQPQPEAQEVGPAAAPLGSGQAKLPPQAADFPALASEDCATVARFYLDAVGERDFARAALVWDDPVIDAARIEAAFAAYTQPQATLNEAEVEGAAGTLYCTITGTLTDAAASDKAASEGALVLSRVNSVPGATAEQLRWRLRSSTFAEALESSQRG